MQWLVHYLTKQLSSPTTHLKYLTQKLYLMLPNIEIMFLIATRLEVIKSNGQKQSRQQSWRRNKVGMLDAILQPARPIKCHLPYCNAVLHFDVIWKPTICQSRNDGKSSLLKIRIQHIAEPVKQQFHMHTFNVHSKTA